MCCQECIFIEGKRVILFTSKKKKKKKKSNYPRKADFMEKIDKDLRGYVLLTRLKKCNNIMIDRHVWVRERERNRLPGA
jgi:tRNA(Arg) A34 adenosine deaminase TadA